MTGDRDAAGFFRQSDPRADRFVYDLPAHWWSRPYEYAWAATFAGKNDVVLDAACGLLHPFKFFLLDTCRETYACDADPKILSKDAILAEIRRDIGPAIADSLPSRYLEGIRYEHCTIQRTPYPDAFFDKVFCISVIEHVPDRFNQTPAWLPLFPLLRPLVAHGIFDAFKELRRILKPDGALMVTFDYPRIHLAYLEQVLRRIGLRAAGLQGNAKPPSDAVCTERDHLSCYHAVLRRAG